MSEAVATVVPDLSVALADTGEGAVLPGWVDTILDVFPLPFLAPSESTVKWIKASTNLFYAWHWYLLAHYRMTAGPTGSNLAKRSLPGDRC